MPAMLDWPENCASEPITPQAMQDHDTTDHRLTELEIKCSFNEDLFDQLNQVVIRQHQKIDALVREVERLRQQIAEESSLYSRAGDESPPHY